jgi:hypothetical protein
MSGRDYPKNLEELMKRKATLVSARKAKRAAEVAARKVEEEAERLLRITEAKKRENKKDLYKQIKAAEERSVRVRQQRRLFELEVDNMLKRRLKEGVEL